MPIAGTLFGFGLFAAMVRNSCPPPKRAVLGFVYAVRVLDTDRYNFE